MRKVHRGPSPVHRFGAVDLKPPPWAFTLQSSAGPGVPADNLFRVESF
ncbi:hypothetical protein GGI1_05945 [Acidithiobacillus sp. GGI-221]|nr:hypothetical protein GGI1_05945 [Acidithiobacillus sp. GGI-221]